MLKEAVRENTKIVFTETIANPVTQVADLVGIGQVCKDKNLVYIVDNTMTSPFSFKPKNRRCKSNYKFTHEVHRRARECTWRDGHRHRNSQLENF